MIKVAPDGTLYQKEVEIDYLAELDFYNFPYAFGLLFAKGLYAEYLKQGDEFLPKYDALLAATGKNDVYAVGQQAGIDIHQKSFWKASLDMIIEDIDKFEGM